MIRHFYINWPPSHRAIQQFTCPQKGGGGGGGGGVICLHTGWFAPCQQKMAEPLQICILAYDQLNHFKPLQISWLLTDWTSSNIRLKYLNHVKYLSWLMTDCINPDIDKKCLWLLPKSIIILKYKLLTPSSGALGTVQYSQFCLIIYYMLQTPSGLHLRQLRMSVFTG